MIIPALRYKDAAKAVSWLPDAFGLTVGEVTPGANDAVAHAEMWHGGGCIMFGSADSHGDWDATPSVAGLYVVVDDVDAHCQRAKAAGAAIMYEPRDTDYGSREYGARDFEGNAWSFGTYTPRQP
jgi:uncharacterized glyoxalase superfamily protein PhnB